jgi:hypothetical protein
LCNGDAGIEPSGQSRRMGLNQIAPSLKRDWLYFDVMLIIPMPEVLMEAKGQITFR